MATFNIILQVFIKNWLNQVESRHFEILDHVIMSVFLKALILYILFTSLQVCRHVMLILGELVNTESIFCITLCVFCCLCICILWRLSGSQSQSPTSIVQGCCWNMLSPCLADTALCWMLMLLPDRYSHNQWRKNVFVTFVWYNSNKK